jgi:hypothetical protein
MAKSLIISGSVNPAGSTATTVTYWNIIGYADRTPNATDKEIPILRDGTLSKLSVKINSSSLTGGATYTLLKNGSPTGLTVSSVSANQTGTFEDLTHSVSVTAGDKFVLKHDPGATTGTNTIAYIQLVFEPTDVSTKTVSFFGNTHGSTRSISTASTTWYYSINGYMDTLNTTESNAQVEMQVSGTFKNFTVKVLSNARTTNTTFTLRKNGADTGIILTFGSTEATTKSDTTNSVTVVAGDLLDIEITTSTGTGTLALASMSIEFENTTSPNGLSKHIGHNLILAAQARNQTLYCAFEGYFDLISTEANAKMKMVDSGFTAKNLGVNIRVNSVASTSNLILRVNGADSTLNVPITSTQTGFLEDITHSVSIAQGDDVNYKFAIGVGSGSQTITLRGYSVYLEAVNPSSGINTTVTAQTIILPRPRKIV